MYIVLTGLKASRVKYSQETGVLSQVVSYQILKKNGTWYRLA